MKIYQNMSKLINYNTENILWLRLPSVYEVMSHSFQEDLTSGKIITSHAMFGRNECHMRV